MVNTTDFLDTIKTSVRSTVITNGTHLSVGTDSTTPTITDTELGNEIFRTTRQEYTEGASDVVISLFVSSVRGNGASIREVGMFDAASSAVDSCDAANWTDSSDMTSTLNNTTYFEGSGSLNLTKDGTGSATASVTKSTTSLNFTSQSLRLILNILNSGALAKLATSNCLTIRFGSDSSNYYQWQKNLADLAVGRNDVSGLTSANAGSTTGTPVLTACDYTYVGLTATGSGITWSAGDFIMDDIALFDGNLLVHEVFSAAVTKSSGIELWIDVEEQIEVTQ